MKDLAVWLDTQIDEDERDAGIFHMAGCSFLSPCPDGCCDSGACDCGYPVRVLTECETKRKVLAHAVEALSARDYVRGADGIYISNPISRRSMRFVVQALAAPYADRPGFQPEWTRPSTPRTPTVPSGER